MAQESAVRRGLARGAELGVADEGAYDRAGEAGSVRRAVIRHPSEALLRLARDDVPEVPHAARRAVPERPERGEGGPVGANWRHRAARPGNHVAENLRRWPIGLELYLRLRIGAVGERPDIPDRRTMVRSPIAPPPPCTA